MPVGFIVCSYFKEEALFCPQCGASLADTVRFCSSCGTSIPQPGSAAVPPPLATAPSFPLVQPSAVSPAPYAGIPQTSGKAIGSLICGIINIFPFFVAAIILGHLSLSDIKKSAGRLKGQGLAIAGLVLGYLGVVAIPFILIIAAIAIPNLLRARIAANESSAAGSLRRLIAAEVSFNSINAATGFTCNLSDLSSAGLIDQSLSSGEKSGYRFALQNCTQETEGGPITKFQIIALPLNHNQSGVRAFCTDESGTIRMDVAGSAENCFVNGSPLD